MKRIGLTGGIGTGKTYIAQYFIKMGIPVFFADVEAKKFYSNIDVLCTLHWHFGDEIFTNEKIDFSKMSKVIFPYPRNIEIVNDLIHPLVLKSFDEWILQQKTSTVMMESALIYEGEFENYFDLIFVVDAPLEVRIERIQKRNPNMNLEDIMRRIGSQLPQEEKCKRADLVISNF